MKENYNTHNILLLTTPFRPNIGGVETHLDDLIIAGVERGWNFKVLTYQPLVTNAHGNIKETGKGCMVFRIPWIRFNLFLKLEKYPALEFLYLFPPLFLIGFIYLIFENSKIRKIHAQGLIAGAVGVLLGKLFNKKVILSTHSIYNFPKSGMYFKFVKFLFNYCEKILCLSHQSRQEILDMGINKSKVEVFTYWVDQKVFHPSSKQISRKLIKENQDAFICLFIGRLVKGKGIPELLQAAKLLKNEVKFVIVGDGPLDLLIKDALKTLTNMSFKGKINNDKLPKYYNAADILLVPSTHEEGYGRVILEAMSCGLPIVATNRGGIKEYINKKTGILINVTPDNLSRTIRSLLNKPFKLRSMRRAVYNYAKIHFNKNNNQIILNSYE